MTSDYFKMHYFSIFTTFTSMRIHFYVKLFKGYGIVETKLAIADYYGKM